MNPLAERISQSGYKLILGSRSPRRRELLAAAGFDFEVVVPTEDAEADPPTDLDPGGLVSELAYRKAADVARRVQRSLVIGCDTVAECDGYILGKPVDRCDARRMLTALSGRRHRVLSGLCLWLVGENKDEDAANRPAIEPLRRVETTVLDMDTLSEAELDAYLSGGKWQGKAGGFGYQDELGWIRIVTGSESNVVGLPMELLADMLEELVANLG